MAHEEEVIANNNEIYSRHLLLFNAEAGHWDCDSEVKGVLNYTWGCNTGEGNTQVPILLH